MPLNNQTTTALSSKKRFALLFISSLVSISPIAIVNASESQSNQALSQRITQLEQQINLLAESNAIPLSAISKTKIGGYGEMHYNNLTTKQNGQATTKKKELDFHRFVLFMNHSYNEDIRFFSELELEHAIAGESQKGEVELEQAYIEMDLTPMTQFKAGVLLQPIGIINETHEPNTFYGVERNPVEKNIIPATWWSGGVALTHQLSQGIQVDLLISEGLKTSDGYSIRKGRQKTSEASANDLAYTGRIKYVPIPGLTLEGSLHYETELSQNELNNSGEATLLEGHFDYQKENFRLKGLYAQWQISGSAAKNAKANQQTGYYLEPSYKVNNKLGFFTRYNVWNNSTQTELENTQINIGANYWPHPDVVFKADYQIQNNGQIGNDKETTGFNLAVGYQF